MIRKTGYIVLGIIAGGLLESLFIGYDYYIVALMILFFVAASDIISFNTGLSRSIRNVEVRREIESNSARKFQMRPIRIFFTNRTRKTVYFHYYDTLSDVFNTEGDFQGYIILKPGEQTKREYSIASIAIGKYKVGPVIIYAEDPMKLCISSYTAPVIDEMIVSPALSDIYTQRSERLSNMKFTYGIHYSQKIGQGYNFYGIRPYNESDDTKYIAWSRYGILNGEDIYIKQMEEERQIDVFFVVDYGIGMNQGTRQKRMYDFVIATVMNASYSIVKNHDGVGYIINSSKYDYFIRAKKSQEPIRKFEQTISEIRPNGDFSIFQTFSRIKRDVKKNALVFVITPFSYPESFRKGTRKEFETNKKVSLFILDPYDFMEKRKDDVYSALMKNSGLKHYRYLTALSKFFNSIGIKSSVSREKDLLYRIMAAYRYGKLTNEGA